MKLLHLVNSANPAGGGPIEGVKQIGHVLQAVGVAIEVVSVDSPDDPWLAEFPFPIYAMGPGRGNYGYSPKLSEWLEARAPDYDVIVVNGIWQYHGFVAHAVTKKLGLGYCVFTHGMLDPWFNQRYPLKRLKKRFYWRFGEYPVLRDARAVMFTCEEEARLAKHSFQPNTWRSRVVHYGTGGPPGNAESERNAFLARFPELDGTRNILFLGRVTAKKGLDLLLAAFSRVMPSDPGLRLVVAGPVDSGIERSLHKTCESLELGDRIVWTGMLGGDEKWGAFRAADAFVLPSHQENFGISVAEALACGIPTLITNKVNIWREVDDAQAGFVDTDTVEGTARMLKSWLELNERAREIMSGNARRLFHERFDLSRSAHELISALTLPAPEAGMAS